MTRNAAVTLQVYSASLDGTVRHWEISEGKVLKIFDVKAAIKSLVDINSLAWMACVGLHWTMSCKLYLGKPGGPCLRSNV